MSLFTKGKRCREDERQYNIGNVHDYERLIMIFT